MGIPSEAPGFIEALEEWNRKLEESGFHDIETYKIKKGRYSQTIEVFLKKSGTENRFKQLSPLMIESNLEYFENIRILVLRTKFDDEEEKKILTLYAEGYTQTKIKEMVPLHRSTIYKKLYKWLRLWKLK